MKIEEVEGIILSETNYSETSKILNVLTYEYGLIGVMSKGCRNMKSKLRGVSRKLVYGKFHIYYKENGLSTLISVDIINSFNKILSDLTKVSYASYLVDLVKQVLKQNDDQEIYNILINTLIKMENDLPCDILTTIVEVKLLDFLGVKPMLDFCSVCGSTNNIISLSSTLGGYVCTNCYQNEGMVSEKTIKLIRMFSYVDIKSITKLDVKNQYLREINRFLDDYYDRYTGLYLKSKDFLKKIIRLEV